MISSAPISRARASASASAASMSCATWMALCPPAGEGWNARSRVTTIVSRPGKIRPIEFEGLAPHEQGFAHGDLTKMLKIARQMPRQAAPVANHPIFGNGGDNGERHPYGRATDIQRRRCLDSCPCVPLTMASLLPADCSLTSMGLFALVQSSPCLRQRLGLHRIACLLCCMTFLRNKSAKKSYFAAAQENEQARADDQCGAEQGSRTGNFPENQETKRMAQSSAV